jgi:hypothetical protein
MSDLNDKVKRLIAKAKETGDMDLLELATDLLDAETGNNGQDPIKKARNSVNARINKEFPEFAMNADDKMPRPVEVKPRENQFVDNGEEFKDGDNATPQVQLTERRRPAFKKVEQTCSRCSKTVEVHPQHAREFYVCDKCLRR